MTGSEGEWPDPEVSGWLARHGLPAGAIVRARRLTGGHRNHNTLLVTRTGEAYVLRRYRHDDRAAVEAALVGRLAGVVPVAEVVAVGRSDHTGEPLLLSRFVPGTLVSELLPGLPAQEAAGLGRAVGRVLAGIGAVRFAGPGFFAGGDLVPVPGPADTDLPAFVDRCLRAAGPAAALAPDERAALRRLASESAPLLATLAGARELVHSDFNPKNLLAERVGGRWTITAVLDWEFAFSGSPLVDIGNMLRFDDEHPAGFAAGFVEGFGAAGGALPARWRQISRALDLFALADLLTRPVDHRYFRRALTALRRQIA